MATLNPAWVRHNNFYNEGGEGFNPHPKFVSASPSAPAGVSRKMIRGKLRTRDEAAKLAKLLTGADRAALLAEIEKEFV